VMRSKSAILLLCTQGDMNLVKNPPLNRTIED
jgi:hypothetical protein